jgi:hypothetical protein
MLFFTRSSRNSAAILRDQHAASERGDRRSSRRLRIGESAERTMTLLRSGDLDGYGACSTSRGRQSGSPGVSNPRIDEWYEHNAPERRGRRKIAAGGGGFSSSTAGRSPGRGGHRPPRRRLVRMDFAFEQGGAMLLMDAMPHAKLRPGGRVRCREECRRDGHSDTNRAQRERSHLLMWLIRRGHRRAALNSRAPACSRRSRWVSLPPALDLQNAILSRPRWSGCLLSSGSGSRPLRPRSDPRRRPRVRPSSSGRIGAVVVALSSQLLRGRPTAVHS